MKNEKKKQLQYVLNAFPTQYFFPKKLYYSTVIPFNIKLIPQKQIYSGDPKKVGLGNKCYYSTNLVDYH